MHWSAPIQALVEALAPNSDSPLHVPPPALHLREAQRLTDLRCACRALLRSPKNRFKLKSKQPIRSQVRNDHQGMLCVLFPQCTYRSAAASLRTPEVALHQKGLSKLTICISEMRGDGRCGCAYQVLLVGKHKNRAVPHQGIIHNCLNI